MPMQSDYSLHYCNSYALLMVNKVGVIKTLYTPFRVKCVEASGAIPENAIVYVEEIYSNERDELLYMVLGKVYPHRSFHLLSNF